MTEKQHWETVYRSKGDAGQSWHQADPAVSLDLLVGAGLNPASSIIDVGGGTSRLVDRLLSFGLSDVTVLDLSETALHAAQHRLGEARRRVEWIAADITAWQNARRFDFWHDRAVFHFLVDPDDRAAYIARLSASLCPGGHALIATFAPDGPDQCSGLPVARYSPESLSEALGKGFDLTHSRREVHQTPWGSAQPFQFSLLRKIG